ncbi:MAG: DNA methyltransferase, partial [Pseudomonadota bacterium]|nr:DNA methyltransferase [Pseudomonadota bacterium]
MELLTLEQASQFATQLLGKPVTPANISYLIQYGRVKKYGLKGSVRVDKRDLEEYYQQQVKTKEYLWKQKCGADLNWQLSFSHYAESQTTKHVHRLHPYKGKFIPQLVEYFLDTHTDALKTHVYFQPGDIVLDPFCGSGTTLVQANELGIHALGLDISAWNTLISTVKLSRYDFDELNQTLEQLTTQLKLFRKQTNHIEFERALLTALNCFNKQFFPSPEFRRAVHAQKIDELAYAQKQQAAFLPIYYQLVHRYQIQLRQLKDNTFLDKWFLQPIRDEIAIMNAAIEQLDDGVIKPLIMIILSRTIRSCRATTHADLATLKTPVTRPYYCKKHGKLCKPMFSIQGWWQKYCRDTVQRLQQFNHLRTQTYQYCLTADSRCVDIVQALAHHSLGELIAQRKIKGIFSSPPYVGLIDYHEQHRYAYDLFNFERNDALEIGPLFRGQGRAARTHYVEAIAAVLGNCQRFLQADYHIFLV